MFGRKKKPEPVTVKPQKVEQVIPCNGKWFAILFGAAGFGTDDIMFRALPVCAWKYVQDDDVEYTVVEPLVWDGVHPSSCQHEPGFRGCVKAGDAFSLAMKLLDQDIEEVPSAQLASICKMMEIPQLGDLSASALVLSIRTKAMSEMAGSE
jgi:hypothetical protein